MLQLEVELVHVPGHTGKWLEDEPLVLVPAVLKMLEDHG